MAPTDEEGRLIELREHLAGEQARLAELRQRVEQATSRASTLKERMVRDRLIAADQAELVADQAESFAAQLEAVAVGPSKDHRLKLAQREREIAAVERRNAAKLRQAGAGPLQLESPPPLHDNAGES